MSVNVQSRGKPLHKHGTYALALIIALTFFGCGLEETNTIPGGDTALTEGDAERGASLFASKGCSGCHGVDATGALGPNIQGYTADMILAMAGAGPMASVSVTEQEAADIAAHLATLGQQEQPAAVDGAPDGAPDGGPLDGAELFISKGCSGCHAADATGAFGPDIQGQTAERILEVAGTGPMAAVSVTSEEAAAIAEWLQSL